MLSVRLSVVELAIPFFLKFGVVIKTQSSRLEAQVLGMAIRVLDFRWRGRLTAQVRRKEQLSPNSALAFASFSSTMTSLLAFADA